MSKKQIIGLVISLVLLAALALGITWAVINFDKVKAGMDGTGLYTKEDIEKSYEDGYSKALEDKAEYERLIQQYRDSVTELSDTISQLNSEVSTLTNSNRDLELNVTKLENNKTALEKSVSELTDIKNQNDESITNLNSEVKKLLAQVKELTLNGGQKQEEIDNLTAQITSLNAIVTQLQNTNNLNLSTIESLNEQITTLNNNINSMLAQGTQNQNTINALNGRISDLEKSVSYYQQLVAAMQNSDKAVATFMYNDAVYNVQVLDKGTTATVPEPVSTAYLIFNGWSIDGETAINLSSYPLTENTTFTALITYRYDVRFQYENTEHGNQIIEKGKFASIEPPTNTAYKEFKGWSVDGNIIINIADYPITQNTTFYAVIDYKADITFKVDNVTHDSQIVAIGKFAALPAEPTKDGYVFKGWAVNGSLVDVTTFAIQGNTIFTAVFNNVYTVRFVLDGATHTTQQVESGTCTNFVPVDNTDYIAFKGWSLDGQNLIDVNNYTITQDTDFIAVIVKSYDVTFLNETATHNTQIIENGKFATVPETPLKEKYVFIGWSIDGTNTVDVGTYAITERTTFTALFKLDKYEVLFKNKDNIVDKQLVDKGGFAVMPDFTSENFFGWTLDGSTIIDLSTYKITGDTTFTARFGTYQSVTDEIVYGYGSVGDRKIDIRVDGLKAGDKIKLNAFYIKVRDGRSSAGGGYNPWEGYVYCGSGGDFQGNNEWGEIQYGSEPSSGEIYLTSSQPWETCVGRIDYYDYNYMTIEISCKTDNTLTIEWKDKAQFYIEQMIMGEIQVLR